MAERSGHRISVSYSMAPARRFADNQTIVERICRSAMVTVSWFISKDIAMMEESGGW